MNEKIVKLLLERNLLVSPDFLENFDGDEEKFLEILEKGIGDNCILNKELLKEKPHELTGEDIAKNDYGVKIVKVYKEEDKKKEVGDFVAYFKSRYNSLRKILQTRIELKDTISVNRVLDRKERKNVALIGLVNDKRTTKNGNIIITLEDPTGHVKLLIKKNSKIFDLAQDIVLDEVIGVTGINSNRFIFVSNILFPDIPDAKIKKCKDEVYVVFTSDLHLGLDLFYSQDFLKFIDWLNGNVGSEKQKEIAKKVKYLFIVGDLVEGIGIYPNQENELVIKDIYEQYKECAKLISKIRKDIKIIICAGNHDALRISEPQPVLDKNIAKDLWELSNVTMVTNPSIVNIHSSKNFDGFNVLLYHGYSFTYFIDTVSSIRLNGGVDRPDLISKFLLQKRHLAPSHTSTLYIPDRNEDPLVIDKIPDFFITAHLHKLSYVNYKNVSLIGCGCWIPQTPYQEKFGFHPDPSRVHVVNLKTRKVQILNFGK